MSSVNLACLGAIAALLAATMLTGCSQSGHEKANDALVPVSGKGGLRINEVALARESASAGGDDERPWMEVINQTSGRLRLGDFTVVTDGVGWVLPQIEIEPRGLYVLRSLQSLTGAAGVFLAAGVREIAIVGGRGEIVDAVRLPSAGPGESVARYPNGTGPFSVLPAEKVTIGTMNPDTGLVNKLAASAAFRPRDSSPNAIVRYDGYYWILGGWSNFGHDLWYSVTDVWRSRDGTDWQIVNAAPPYIHYCSFVLWKGRIWAIGPSSYSSTDGVVWRPERITAPALNRSVIFNDMLVTISGSTVLASRDGSSWLTLTDSAPWGVGRQQPAVLVYRDHIWVIGGVTGYGTADQTHYNDVWASGDGTSWHSVSTGSSWSPRLWASAIVYDDKMFLLNGTYVDYQPDQYGNTSEIWYTDDGLTWLELKSEYVWPARHASFTALDENGGVLVIGGYGAGGVTRLYNDVWRLRASLYFPKPAGALHRLDTWGRNLDGSGASPASFGDDHQVFVLRNRDSFSVDERWSVSGVGSRILVGDGSPGSRVVLNVNNRSHTSQPLFLNANSTTNVHGSPPLVLYKDAAAVIIVQ